MNEQQLGRQISKILDQDLSIDMEVKAVLNAARQVALERQRQSLPSTGAAKILQYASQGFEESSTRLFRLALASLVLLAGIGAVNYWFRAQLNQDTVRIDAAVLTGELPIEAYLDTGFSAWLRRSSAE